MASTEKIAEMLKDIKYPGFNRDLVSFGIIKGVQCKDDQIEIALAFSTEDDEKKNLIKQSIENKLETKNIRFIDAKIKNESNTKINPVKIPGIKHIIAVASGKGGVGKSTVSVNIACALSKLGKKVAVLDSDMSGPNIPKMCGVSGPMEITDQQKIVPHIKHQLTLMSLGFFLEGNSPVIWRGPMIHTAIKQLINDTVWGKQDLLIVDLPPGTGDAQLTLSQLVAIDGVLIVTTPQDVALLDASRGVAMFQKMNIPIMGIIENMSYYICPNCKHQSQIFSKGGGRKEAKKLNVPFIGEIPLEEAVCEGGDSGIPIVIAQPESTVSIAFTHCADAILRYTGERIIE